MIEMEHHKQKGRERLFKKEQSRVEALEERQYKKRLREHSKYFTYCRIQKYETKYVGERFRTPLPSIGPICFLTIS